MCVCVCVLWVNLKSIIFLKNGKLHSQFDREDLSIES